MSTSTAPSAVRVRQPPRRPAQSGAPAPKAGGRSVVDAPLGWIEQVGGMTFVGWGIVTAQQNASRIGACQRLRELSFELCRRLRWKLQIEPAPRLDFSHDHGLPPPPSR